MNTENSMTIGDPYPATWEQPEETTTEIIESFQAWFANEPVVEHNYFSYFLEDWYHTELYSFMLEGTFKKEFYKWYVTKLAEEFKADTTLDVPESAIKQYIGV